MFNARMKSDVLGIVAVLSNDGSNEGGGILGGILPCPFLFFVLKQMLACVICSYYRTISSHYVLRPLRKPRFSSRAARILFDSG